MKALKDKQVNVRGSAARAIGDSAPLPALTEEVNDMEVMKVNAPTTVEKEARKAIDPMKENWKYAARRVPTPNVEYSNGSSWQELAEANRSLCNECIPIIVS